jgi:hypothetical protein
MRRVTQTTRGMVPHSEGDTDMTVIEMAKASAAVAAQGYVELYLGGEDAYPCGFAWVEVKPKHKGNTKDGKAERVVLKDMGFKLDYTGKTFSYACSRLD